MRDSEKIKKIRDVLKMDQETFAASIGYGQAVISHIETGRRSISSQMARKIASKHNFNIEWILLGKGEALSLKELQGDHSSDYQVHEPDSSYSRPENRQGERKNMIIVPLKAVGGFLMGYKNKVYLDSLEHAAFPNIQGTCFRFEVEGYSMMPTYPPQSHVVCTPVEGFEHMQKNKDYVLATIDGLPLKRFAKIEKGMCHIFSLNKEYDGIKPIPLNEIKGIYLVELQILNPYR